MSGINLASDVPLIFGRRGHYGWEGQANPLEYIEMISLSIWWQKIEATFFKIGEIVLFVV
jgi:hypothetical protein